LRVRCPGDRQQPPGHRLRRSWELDRFRTRMLLTFDP
jgi:hypothetical protein